jgi:hypothetical protein
MRCSHLIPAASHLEKADNSSRNRGLCACRFRSRLLCSKGTSPPPRQPSLARGRQLIETDPGWHHLATIENGFATASNCAEPNLANRPSPLTLSRSFLVGGPVLRPRISPRPAASRERGTSRPRCRSFSCGRERCASSLLFLGAKP